MRVQCFRHVFIFGFVGIVLSMNLAFGVEQPLNGQRLENPSAGENPKEFVHEVVDQWDVYEVALTTSNTHANPFDETLIATLSGPNGENRSVIGFFAGDNVYKLRFMATQIGEYRWVTFSSDPDLHRCSGGFEVVSSSLPSMVVVDSTYPNQFRYTEGDYIMIRAYYALNLLGADRSHPLVGGWQDLIDHLISYGYNTLFFVPMAVGQTTSHRDKMPPWSLVSDAPPSHAFQSDSLTDFFFVPWPKAGTTDRQPEPGGRVDFTRFYLPFWDELDNVLNYLRANGMIAHIMFYPDDNPYIFDLEQKSAHEQRFFRYLIARVSAYSNVIWNDGIDLWEYREVDSWVPWWAQFFMDNDPWRHPLTSRHFSGARNLQSSLDHPLLTFASGQIDGMYDEWVGWMRQNKKPVTADDGWYENQDPNTLAGGDGDDFRDMLWESVTAGGVGILQRDDWGMGMWLSRVGEGLSGHVYNKIQMDCLRENVAWWKMQPRNELVSTSRYCLSDPLSGEYLVYFAEELPQTIQIDLSERSGNLAVQWMNAATGSTFFSEPVLGGSVLSVTAPSDDDWVLHLIPVEGVEEEQNFSQPTIIELLQNYPNPFNPTTEITYRLSRDVIVNVDIYNLLGHRVATLVDERQEAGVKTVTWDARSFSSGIYFCRISAGEFLATRRMLLLK